VTDRRTARAGTAVGALCTTAEALLANTSETASLALAELVVRRYRSLKPGERFEFLTFLLHDLGASRVAVDLAIDAYRLDRSESSLARLFQAVEPRRQALVRAINMAAGGTWTVLTMRSDLLTFLDEHPEMEPVEADLFHVLSSWFSRGFIVLERINWRSPGAVLERLIEYEAVHEIRGWDDLRRRLEADRRCFGFFHPAIADEPLIFIEVALTRGLASSIQELLDAPSPDEDNAPADTATFYSITNCQSGLRGIQLGNFLIKQVVHELAAELPQLSRFATLSPIPGFASWLDRAGHTDIFSEEDRVSLRELENPFWFENPTCAQDLKPVLLRACAHYLVNVKRGQQPADSVARFHLRNGARLERINWLGDTSVNGMRQSRGLLVNYDYDATQIDRNHEAYVHEGVVAHSDGISRLLSRS
jgi:malonyl-CoA decarboxylase